MELPGGTASSSAAGGTLKTVVATSGIRTVEGKYADQQLELYQRAYGSGSGRRLGLGYVIPDALARSLLAGDHGDRHGQRRAGPWRAVDHHPETGRDGRSAMGAYVFFGQQGDRRMVRPHALWPVLPEVGQDGLLTVAYHYRESDTIRLGFVVSGEPHFRAVR